MNPPGFVKSEGKEYAGDGRLNKYKEQNLLLHTIAHEIRNPLVSVRGFASLLFEEYGKILPNEGKKYIERILSNLKRVENLLSDLSELARISIDESEYERVAAQEMIATALDSLFYEIEQKNIAVIVQPNMPVLYCNSKALIQAITNLISNAIKYSRERSESKIEIGYLDDEIFHKFFVKDNGVGMRACDRNKVFQIFSRLRNKKGVSGSGLGLAIVKRIIEGHGGEIWVDSKRNKFATFYFTLPKVVPNFQ
jgi:signal transduction histidine kinase